jgi:hypothetical protein
VKVLSLTEPFATLILNGNKKIETRSFKTKYRGELYIHASHTKIPKAWKSRKELMALVEDKPLHFGTILCKCNLVDCVYMTEEYVKEIKEKHPMEYICGEYEVGRYAWILEEITPLDEPIKAKGHLSIWEYFTEEEIMNLLSTVQYGWMDKENKRHSCVDSLYSKQYKLQSAKEVLKNKIGVCWDQVELERDCFKKSPYQVKTYALVYYDNKNCPMHTFLVYEKENKYYWFEHAWEKYRGIHRYDTLENLLFSVRDKFIADEIKDEFESENLCLYEYSAPEAYISCIDFYKHIEKSKNISFPPFYFYHLVDKNVDMTKGLISLQYMYDHKLYDLFDKAVLKYKNRITGDWQIEKYKGKTHLTREEFIDALRIFRGEDGANCIYFFKYPPYKELGNKIRELSLEKDIYRIDLHNEELQKQIRSIFYGYDGSHSDHACLEKVYYEKITKKEYFEKYDDSIPMNFSTLNHISVCFKNGNCPYEFLEKVKWEENNETDNISINGGT